MAYFRAAFGFSPRRRIHGAPGNVAGRSDFPGIQWFRPMALLVALLGSFFCATLWAQGPPACVPPGLPAHEAGKNALGPKEEAELGKLAASALAWDHESFSDTAVAAYPEAILRRLLKNLPASAGLHLQIRFYDAAFPDAFDAPGGRIYISRQVAAYLHSESDLAALLAHETGHALAHQGAVEFAQVAKQLAGVRSFPSPASVVGAYNRVLDQVSADPKAASEWAKKEAEREEPDQEVADRTALYLLASAGYPPQAMENLFNRLAQTHGKTGNWLTDLFGMTKPSEERLRALIKSIDKMPAACGKQGAPTPVGDSAAWRAALISLDSPPGGESLPGLLRQGRLQPGVPSTIGRIRFSPDGHYLLAYSPSGILVYATNPLAFQFRIDGPHINYAGFSSDSQSVIFHTEGMRVERWSIASRKRVSLHMAVPLDPCWEESDSPDGQFMAVMGCGAEFSLLDESTGATVFREKGKIQFGAHAFSPDSRYFVVANRKANTCIAVDLKTGEELPLSQALRTTIGSSSDFAFLGPDRLAIYGSPFEPGGIYLVNFPSGKLIKSLKISPPAGAQSEAKGVGPGGTRIQVRQINFSDMPTTIGVPTKVAGGLLLFPFQKYAAVLLDLVHLKLVSAFPTTTIDVFGEKYAVQHEGWITIDDLRSHRILQSLELPAGMLGSLESARVSPDLKWLAISNSRVGAVYSLSSVSRIDETPEFTSAWFGAANALYADFPQANGGGPAATPPGSVVKRIDLEKSAPPFRLEAGADESQYGPFLLAFHTGKGKGDSQDSVELEVHSLPKNNVLWKRSLPDKPPTLSLGSAGKMLLLGWPILPRVHVGLFNSFDFTPEALRHYLRIKKKDTGYAFQIFDAKTGKLLGHIFLSGLSALVLQDASVTGDDIVLSDRMERTQVYSWKTDQREGLALGRAIAISPDGKLVCLADTPRELRIAPLPSMEEASAPVKFSRRISLARFSRDGRRLFVLTRDQRFFLFKVPPLGAPAGKAAAE